MVVYVNDMLLLSSPRDADALRRAVRDERRRRRADQLYDARDPAGSAIESADGDGALTVRTAL